jgi:hypothetical protein
VKIIKKWEYYNENMLGFIYKGTLIMEINEYTNKNHEYDICTKIGLYVHRLYAVDDSILFERGVTTFFLPYHIILLLYLFGNYNNNTQKYFTKNII